MQNVAETRSPRSVSTSQRFVDDLVAAIRVVQSEGVAIVLVEQKLRVPMALASRQYLIENGQIAWTGTTDELRRDQRTVESLVGFYAVAALNPAAGRRTLPPGDRELAR